MKIKNIILSCLMLIGAISATAQTQETKTVYEFRPHWNIFLQPVGAQYTLGETSFNDLISYNVQGGFGYRFTPVIGARLAINAWQSKGAWDMNGYQAIWKWNYVAPMVDATVNLSNLFCGYNPNRLLNIGIFAGIGANIAWNNGEAADVKEYLYQTVYNQNSDQNLEYLWDGTKVRLAGRVGVTADFRISDRFTAGLELQATTVNDHYNSKNAGNSDWYFNALVGVKYNLGKSYTKKEVKTAPCCPPERIVEKVVEKIVEKPVAVKEEKAFRRDVFFTVNCTKISADEMTKVAEISNYLKENPNATITITGYADKDTGNAKINQKLSEKRAEAVADALMNKFGIAKSRIKTDSKGDTVQPFAENILNRVSICIAE